MGIENVTVQIEEPFRVLHLESLCSALASAANDLKPWDGAEISTVLWSPAQPNECLDGEDNLCSQKGEKGQYISAKGVTGSGGSHPINVNS